MRWTHIKLYSFTAPLVVMPFMMDITLSGIWDYVRGDEFRAFAAELVTQLITGVADAAIITLVSQFFAAVGG